MGNLHRVLEIESDSRGISRVSSLPVCDRVEVWNGSVRFIEDTDLRRQIETKMINAKLEVIREILLKEYRNVHGRQGEHDEEILSFLQKWIAENVLKMYGSLLVAYYLSEDNEEYVDAVGVSRAFMFYIKVTSEEMQGSYSWMTFVKRYKRVVENVLKRVGPSVYVKVRLVVDSSM